MIEHKFIPSNLNALLCGVAGCGRNEFDHSDKAQCESCDNIGHMSMWSDMLLCRECINKEMKTALEHQSPEKSLSCRLGPW